MNPLACALWVAARLVAFSAVGLVFTMAAEPPLERDLGQGLAYVRMQRLPADLPPNPPGRVKPCVVDARYTEADADAAKLFLAWLKFRATPRSPVFVLVNGETSAAMLAALATRDAATGIMVVGVATPQLMPDSPVRVTREDERRAYDALAAGAEIGALLADNPHKARNDEASLAKDRPAELPPEPSVEVSGARRAPPLIDVALQRAVHLHRALAALKRI